MTGAWLLFVFMATGSVDVERQVAVRGGVPPIREAERDLVTQEKATEADRDKYAEVLRVMHEVPLCSAARTSVDGESYRFLWLRTFHRPLLVDLVLGPGDRASAVLKEASGAAGYGIGRLVRRTRIDVFRRLRREMKGPDNAKAFLRLFRESADEAFWAQPFRSEDRSVVGVDGATWTIEGVRNGRCHVVRRWSPDEGEPFRQFAERLLYFANRRLDYDEVY